MTSTRAASDRACFKARWRRSAEQWKLAPRLRSPAAAAARRPPSASSRPSFDSSSSSVLYAEGRQTLRQSEWSSLVRAASMGSMIYE